MNITSDSSADEWHKGSLNKIALWSFYSAVNISGAILCLIVIYAVYKLPRRNTGDVLITSLCWGCFMMSATCGLQCFLNIARGWDYFSWGSLACKFEAFAHISSVMLQFFSLTAIALHSYISVAHKINISVRKSLILVSILITASCSGTLISSIFSEIYLMPTGTYCLFKLNSPTILFWFIPIMIIALIINIWCYISLFCLTRRIVVTTYRWFGPPSLATEVIEHMVSQDVSIELARKSIVYIAVFFVGWGAAIPLTFYELASFSSDKTGQIFDIALAVPGSIHSIAVPIAYGYMNPRIKNTIICRKGSDSSTVSPI